MPFRIYRILPYVIGGIGAGVLILAEKYGPDIWKRITTSWFGKRVVVLGDIETGKTTLHKFLREGEIVTKHNATRRKTKQKANILKLEDLQLIIKEGYDVSGQKDFATDWKLLFKDSDICFYMIDCYKVSENNSEYLKTLKFHLTHIQKWKEEFKNSPKIILIGAFCDKIDGFDKTNSSNIQKFEENLRSKFKEAYLKLNISPSSIFFGSLKTEDSISKLVIEIIKNIK